MADPKKRLIIIDSNALIHRAYHALPPLTTKEGEVVGAVYGFLLVFFRAIKELRPDYVAACFDFPAPTFRHKKYAEYKAKRPKAPDDLYSQIPKVKELLQSFGAPIFEKEGFEADDIIGTIARLAPRERVAPDIETIILSGDLDTLQLVDDHTKVYLLRKGVKDIVLYGEESVREKYHGLSSGQLLDYRALRGDPSDNIPGVAGIGEKTAIDLLLKFKTLENIYKEIEENSDNSRAIKLKVKEILLRYREQAFLSRELADIAKNVPIDFNLEKCRWGAFDGESVAASLAKLGFYSLIKKVPELKQ